MTINDFAFNGKRGLSHPMSVLGGIPIARLSNYHYWKTKYRRNQLDFLSRLMTGINHETIHNAVYSVDTAESFWALDYVPLFGADETMDYFGIKIPEELL